MLCAKNCVNLLIETIPITICSFRYIIFNTMIKKSIKYLLFFLAGIVHLGVFGQVKLLDKPPLHYVCYRAAGPMVMDGRLDEADWQHAPWTEDFIDIEGPHMPTPFHRTRVKMLWDNDYLYIAAELEEDHIWATFTERESIIFHENNFEVFIDPSGDTHNYYELEINALGTIWDLMLTKPYRNSGLPISAWDISGFKKGIKLKGTINDPSDTDTLWIVEMAFPWRILSETAPLKRKPKAGERWRINFSRVQWQLDIVDGAYKKTINPETGQAYPEYNWVWSPQWAIDMHRPEYWGYLQFSDIVAGQGNQEFVPDPDAEIKYLLRELYYLQQAYKTKHGQFAETPKLLLPEKPEWLSRLNIVFDVAVTSYRLSAASHDGKRTWHIRQDSRLWMTTNTLPILE